MALAAGTLWEVQTGGSDPNNSGGFNPSNASMATDLAATAANTASPVVTSASYTFIAGDVNAWLYIKSGTNWVAGWHQIVSVSAGAATLSAAIGAAVRPTLSSLAVLAPSTTVGCATVASPTTGTWSIDYSQQAAKQFNGTDLVVDGTTNTKVTSATHTFTKADVGNLIQITAGTGFTTGWYEIVSVTSGAATLDRSPAAVSTTGGTWCLGGALASPGQAGKAHVASNGVHIKSGTYSITSASVNVAGGVLAFLATSVVSSQSRAIGYGSLRGDGGTRPLLQASGITTATLIGGQSVADARIENINVDGASLTSIRGIGFSNQQGQVVNCKVVNCTNAGIQANIARFCEVSGCTVGAASTAMQCNYATFCYVHDNTGCSGFIQASGPLYWVNCVSVNNANGFASNSAQTGVMQNCTSYGNTATGFSFGSGFVPADLACINCLAVSNGTTGFSASAVNDSAYLYNCAAYLNTSGNFSNNILHQVGNITLTADPFVSSATKDFRLNNNAGGGAACRAAGFGTVGGLTQLGYQDIGAYQSRPVSNPGASLLLHL